MHKRKIKNKIYCVRQGDKYTTQHVDNLFRMLKRNITLDFDFECLDDSCFDFRGLTKHWSKMNLFTLDQEFTYFDLDIIIQKNIDSIFEQKNQADITLIKIDWATSDYAKSLGITPENKMLWVFNNSSVMHVNPRKTKDIWLSFDADRKKIMQDFYGIDAYLWHNWEKRCAYFESGFFYSYLHGAIFPDKESKHRPEYHVCLLDGDIMPEDIDWLTKYT